MQIAILTSAPDIIDTYLNNTILAQAMHNDSVLIHTVNIRNYAKGNYKQIDDTPFGGGSGMVLMAEPLIEAIESAYTALGAKKEDTRVIYPSPQGQLWDHKVVTENAKADNIIFICGRYKGIDQRFIDKYVTHEYSLGDFVVSNGELGSIVMVDSIVRLLPGTMNNIDSALSDSFANNLLDHPHYTKPRILNGIQVPEILLGGNHEKIKSWRKSMSENITKAKRPDLWKKYNKSIKQLEINHE